MACSADVTAALLGYLGDEEAVTALCEANGGCASGYADCMLTYLTASGQQTAADQGAGYAGLLSGIDTMFLLFSAYLVFMMQLGFAMLCAGSIRSKNCMNILLKNVLDSCVGAMGFYLLGFGFAYGHHPGKTSNGFIGNWNFALSFTTQTSFQEDGNFAGEGWHAFFFQWSFAAATTTILSGAVAERCAFGAYLGYAFFISAFVYPVIVHWMWAGDGWLSAFNTSKDGYAEILKTGAIDFAGSGVVHMTGGFAALVGAWIMGPRVGRFASDGSVNKMPGHSATLVVMGTFLLWFGWYGFNPGSNLVIGSRISAEIVGRAAVCTTMSAAAGGLSMLIWKFVWTKTWDTVAVCNGVLGGLVAITAGCSVLEAWAAIIVGAIAGIAVAGAENFVLRVLKVDDPVGAFAVHGVGGMVGVLYVGIMAKHDYVVQVYGGYGLGPDAKEGHRYGLFYGGHAQLLLCQFIEILVIGGWTSFMLGAYFFAMKAAGLLRVPIEVEMAGLDASKHGGSAYYHADEPTVELTTAKQEVKEV